MNNKVLVIAGMHRSGTSLITQWLHKCGLHIGNDTLGPWVGNIDGHFEDVDFYNNHRAILSELQLPDNGLITQALPGLSDKQQATLKALINIKNEQQAEWGWKDPRTCLFLPVYGQLLPTARYLVIWRDYRSVVSSLISRLYNAAVAEYIQEKGCLKFIWNRSVWKRRKQYLFEEHSEYYLKVWINYNEIIMAFIQQLPADAYLVVDHTALLVNDNRVFEQLSGKWGFTLRYCPFKTVYKEKQLSQVMDIDWYVQDKSLLVYASQLQRQLSSMPSPQLSTNSQALW